MSGAAGATPRPATAATPDELLELLQAVRRELRLRGEDFQGPWVESAVEELRTGRQPGWFLSPGAGGGGLAFGNRRDGRGWAHVHATDFDGAMRLAEALVESFVTAGQSLTVGFSGLTVESERRLLDELVTRPGSEIIERFCMVRTLRGTDADPVPFPPGGLERVAVRDVTVAALTDLDWRSFRGSVDDRLVGGSAEEYGRVLDSVLANSLGLFLDAASTALLRREPIRLVGGLLTVEVTAREAVFVDLMVDPEFRRGGVGRWLLHWGFRSLAGLGYSQVRLWVTAVNTPAMQLYESEGFRRVAATRLYRWDRPGDPAQAQRSR